MTESETKMIDKEVTETIEDAVRYAEDSPLPEISSALEDIYA
jgi:TPP-dependent pyruvate/acetoin dehydrogenase alpha subunit